MPEARSALHSLAAISVRRTSAPMLSAITLARSVMRSTRSAMVPSLAWKVTPFSLPSQRSKFPALRSASQKKRASDRRAVSTRALPWAITAPPSVGSMLAVTTKCGASLPVLGSRTAK